MNEPVITLDDHLRLAIEGDGQRLAAQLNQDDAQQLAIALIEFSRKEINSISSVASHTGRTRDGN
jgi:hypothetical protein